jgi:two-component system, LuxR family, sensor kinase FixL
MGPKTRINPSKSRANLTSPVVASGGGAWSLDATTGEAELSAGARRLLEIPDADPVGDLIGRLPVAADARRRASEAIRACQEHGADFDLRLARVGGAGALRLIGGAVAGRDGASRPIVGVVFDADEETQLAREAAQRSAHVRSILETALDGMVVIDVAGRIEAFNSSTQRMFGYSEAEALGQNVRILMGDHDRPRHDGYIGRYVDTGERRIIGIGRIVTGQRKDGSQFPLHLSIGETKVEGRRLFTGIMHDLTEERRSEGRTQALQAELAHISRLSALGEMGTALAHELNQPLAAIGNYITGSRRLLANAPSPIATRVDSALERAAEQVLRAGHIIRRLRDFVSRRVSERSVESLARLVEEASALGLVGARERGVTLTFKLDALHDAVVVDPIQIEQVLVNLLRNGLDAMANAPRRKLSVSSRLVAPALVEVAVADTGPGLAPDTRARLFEPFFTTKSAGLGVGLSISRGIVEAHGGVMSAENNEDGGATFRFTLPTPGGDAP